MNCEAGVGGGVGARQETECVLQVEGGDGDVGRCREGNTRYCRGRQNKKFKGTFLKNIVIYGYNIVFLLVVGATQQHHYP